MTFTIEQLEALKEGTTPGPWGHTSLGYEAEKYPVYGDVPGDEVALVRQQDWELVSAGPALLDQLIATEKAYGRAIELVGKLRSDVYFHGNVDRIIILKSLDKILEGNGSW